MLRQLSFEVLVFNHDSTVHMNGNIQILDVNSIECPLEVAMLVYKANGISATTYLIFKIFS